jgi:hypothetical protein
MKPVDRLNRGCRYASIETLTLAMVGIAATLAMISYRYHLAAVTYGPFVKEQVLASTTFRGLLERAFGRTITLDGDKIERQGTPFYPRYGFTMPPNNEPKISYVGSDYLAVWHYNREWMRGKNPYQNSDPVFYVSRETGVNSNGHRVIVDPEVPDQPETNLRYFPLTLVISLPFYLTNYYASFLLYMAAFHLVFFSLCGWIIWLSRGYRFQATVLMLVLYLASYPIGFLVDRGNIEGAIFIWVAAGLILYKNGYLYPAAICLGLAAGTKLTPALFFALFLLDGRIKPFLVAVIVMIGSTALSLASMHDPFLTVFQQMRQHIGDPSTENQPATMGTRFNHSLLNVVRAIPPLLFSGQREWNWTGRLYKYWPALILPSTLVILLRLRRLPFSNRVFVLTCMMLAFPYASYDYRLILLYIPLGLIFLEIVREGRAAWPEAAICLLTMLLFAPKAYELSGRGIDFAVNGITLVVLIILGLIPPSRSGPATENSLVA